MLRSGKTVGFFLVTVLLLTACSRDLERLRRAEKEVESELGTVPIPVKTGVKRRETFFKQGKARASIVFRTELDRSEFNEVIVSHLSNKHWTQIDDARFCRGDLDADLTLDGTEGNAASYWTLSFSYGYRPLIGAEYPKNCS